MTTIAYDRHRLGVAQDSPRQPVKLEDPAKVFAGLQDFIERIKAICMDLAPYDLYRIRCEMALFDRCLAGIEDTARQRREWDLKARQRELVELGRLIRQNAQLPGEIPAPDAATLEALERPRLLLPLGSLAGPGAGSSPSRSRHDLRGPALMTARALTPDLEGSAPSGTVYLLHFDRPLHHAQHYLGFSESLEQRLADHRSGRGARLVEVFTELGIGFELVRTWPGDRRFERRLKRQKHAWRHCPKCRAERQHPAGSEGGH